MGVQGWVVQGWGCRDERCKNGAVGIGGCLCWQGAGDVCGEQEGCKDRGDHKDGGAGGVPGLGAVAHRDWGTRTGDMQRWGCAGGPPTSLSPPVDFAVRIPPFPPAPPSSPTPPTTQATGGGIFGGPPLQSTPPSASTCSPSALPPSSSTRTWSRSSWAPQVSDGARLGRGG